MWVLKYKDWYLAESSNRDGWRGSSLARDPDAQDQDLLPYITPDNPVHLRREIASRPSLDPELQKILAQDPSVQVRMKLIDRTDLDPETIMLLLTDSDPFIRKQMKKNMPEDFWYLSELIESRVAEDPYLVRLKKLAWSPNTSEDLLKELAVHSDLTVRMGVARNPSISTGLLKQLSQDPSNWVRIEATKNPNITSEILFDLLMDSNEYVAAAARKKLPPDMQILADIF